MPTKARGARDYIYILLCMSYLGVEHVVDGLAPHELGLSAHAVRFAETINA